MRRTLQMLQTLITETTKGMTLEEVSYIYRQNLDPSLLAYAYKHLYGLIDLEYKKWYGITSEDAASYSLQVLDTCLQVYDGDRSKFVTFFMRCFRNKLGNIAQSNGTDLRKINLELQSLDALKESGAFPDVAVEQDFPVEVSDILPTNNLTQKELELCRLVMDGYSLSEAAGILGVSTTRVSHLKDSIKKKVPSSSV